MEWSKEKTLKLIGLLQVNANLWNSSLCDSRRDKQKRKEELRSIAEILGISIADATKKIQHLRTQYNRESAKEARAYVLDSSDRYISNWYAFEYLHFLKDSTKPYSVIQDVHTEDPLLQSDSSGNDCKLPSLSPPQKVPRSDAPTYKQEPIYSQRMRDEFSVFGEYVANELRSLKGEKNLLVAKKKIQDAIYDVKMGMITEPHSEVNSAVFTHSSQQNGSLHVAKIYNGAALGSNRHIETLQPHTPPTSGMNEIIINSACHYTNFKVDSQ